jgi:TPR repeat protein
MASSNTAEYSEPALTDPSPGAFYALGMQCSIGGEVPADLVSAHKWFNLAAMGGNQDAIRLRCEIAAQMSNAEIGAAQRAARDYIKLHPTAFAPPALRLHAAA